LENPEKIFVLQGTVSISQTSILNTWHGEKWLFPMHMKQHLSDHEVRQKHQLQETQQVKEYVS